MEKDQNPHTMQVGLRWSGVGQVTKCIFQNLENVGSIQFFIDYFNENTKEDVLSNENQEKRSIAIIYIELRVNH